MGTSTTTKTPGLMRRLGRQLVVVAVVLVGLQILGAIIGPPQWLGDWLTAAALKGTDQPRYVVVLGGGGMPSESTLLRVYRAAEFGQTLTNAIFVVSLPADADPATSSVGRMRDELVLRGIPLGAVRMETHGRNTYEEAVGVRRLLGPEALNEPLAVVTSGYHMRRAVLCFRKEGFTRVQGMLATSVGAEADPGPYTLLRYAIWSNWEHEAQMGRELVALVVYKLKGWI